MLPPGTWDEGPRMDPVPALGEHTDAILRELGIDAGRHPRAARGGGHLMDPRTYLFVPGNRPERFAKALASGADAVVLDLEDAVAPPAKGEARDAIAQWSPQAADADRARIVVRINDAQSSCLRRRPATAARRAHRRA